MLTSFCGENETSGAAAETLNNTSLTDFRADHEGDEQMRLGDTGGRGN
jgi:hypothetical protein